MSAMRSHGSKAVRKVTKKINRLLDEFELSTSEIRMILRQLERQLQDSIEPLNAREIEDINAILVEL